MSKVEKQVYHPTGIVELDRVLNGGLLYGKVVFLGGLHGGGKSRLLLQLAGSFAKGDRKVFWISGEDGRDDLVQFALQLGVENEHVILEGNPEGIDLDYVLDEARKLRAKLIILDSLQVIALAGTGGDVGKTEMVEAVCQRLTAWAKEHRVSVILIGQLNNSGEYAGGAKVRHLVDLLLRLDPMPVDDVGEGRNTRRLWIDGKSRQGSSNNSAWLVMRDEDGRMVSPSSSLALKLARLSAAK